MSYTATAEVLAMRIPGTAKLVLAALADFANERTGACYPRVRAIAEKASVSESTVKRWLRWARAIGLIAWSHLVRKDGSHGPNTYKLLWRKNKARVNPGKAKPVKKAGQPSRPKSEQLELDVDRGPFVIRPIGWIREQIAKTAGGQTRHQPA